MIVRSNKITINRIRKPKDHNLNDELQWFFDSLGLLGNRDRNKSCFRMVIVLLKSLRQGEGMTSDEIADKIMKNLIRIEAGKESDISAIVLTWYDKSLDGVAYTLSDDTMSCKNCKYLDKVGAYCTLEVFPLEIDVLKHGVKGCDNFESKGK